MRSAGKRELVGHETRRSVALKGGCAVLFGLPFAAMGGFMILASSGVLPAEDSSFHASRLIVGAIGGLFLLAGLVVIGSGVAGLLRGLRVRRRQRERPWEPWYWDHPWDPQAYRLGTVGKTVTDVVGMVAVSVFVTPFCVYFFPFGLVFGLLAAVGWGFVAYRWLQRLKYGASELQFARFPFFLGDELDASLGGSARLRGYTNLKLTLRCVEEKVERRGKSNGVVAYALYEDEREYAAGEVDLGQGPPARLVALITEDSPPLQLSFRLPDQPELSTSLSADEPRYWELEVKAEIPGIDYKAVFLLPVYARA
ncbi:MAG: hypothetical protein IPP07_19885 [Holophagales bacterium]|nr:hypothetical protein [Holophagales bacterium]MBK9967016.1 hypothetical protein [Holophagales bacterium]